ncbi:MAG: class I tRNA ligase family protein, partial [Candidatus Rokuibacteriota bacterium]
MSKYQGWLVDYVQARPDFIRPERYRNEILGFLRDPLQDLSISRPRTRLEWGIPLPFDDRYVTYVWFDALVNYVSALGGPGAAPFARYWPHARHLIGKDIVKPHAIYWPCMLKAAGLDVYRHLDVHGYWTVDGQKMSKSLGNVVDPVAFAAGYGEAGNDAFRYFVLREMTFGLDADFSAKAFGTRFNADLANDLGNLVSRATTLIANFEGGRLPEPGQPELYRLARPSGLEEAWNKARAAVEAAMDEFAFQRALAALWEFIGALNRFVDVQQPWALAKDPKKASHLRTVLYELGQALYCLSIVLGPFVPDAVRKIRGALCQTGEPRLSDASWGGLVAGTTIARLSGLFPRADDGKAAKSPAAAKASAQPDAASSASPVTKAEFARVELRVAEVLAAEAVPKS